MADEKPPVDSTRIKDAAPSPPPSPSPSSSSSNKPVIDEKLFKAYELYLSERTRLSGSKEEQAKAYDQTILTYSAGAIALSITFLEKVVKNPNATGWLYTSWILFAFAMISTLYSHLVSQKAFEGEITGLDRLYRKLIGLKDDDADVEQSAWGVSYRWLTAFANMFSPALNLFRSGVKWLNRFAGAFFFAGVVCFGWFALQNWVLLKQEKSSVATPKTPRDIERPIIPGTGTIPDRGVLPPIKVPQDKTPPPPSKGK